MEKEVLNHGLNLNRRHFLSKLSLGLGSAALGSLLIPDLFNGSNLSGEEGKGLGLPHFAPKAKRVILNPNYEIFGVRNCLNPFVKGRDLLA